MASAPGEGWSSAGWEDGAGLRTGPDWSRLVPYIVTIGTTVSTRSAGMS